VPLKQLKGRVAKAAATFVEIKELNERRAENGERPLPEAVGRTVRNEHEEWPDIENAVPETARVARRTQARVEQPYEGELEVPWAE
jgi:hypothetical protein